MMRHGLVQKVFINGSTGEVRIEDSLRINNTPTGNSSDSVLVKRNSVVYAVARSTVGGTSGTYTPTLTNNSNITTSTATTAKYTRIGNIVTVSGSLYVDFTTSGFVSVELSLPIASDLANDYDVSGTANMAAGAAVMLGETTNDTAKFFMQTSSSADGTFYYTYMYIIN